MEKDREIVDSVERLKDSIDRVKSAQKEFSKYTQEKVDKIFLAAASAANKARIPLAKMAVEETGFGVWQDKVLKNTLLKRAFNELGITDFDADLNGATSVAFGAEISQPTSFNKTSIKYFLVSAGAMIVST